MLYRGPRAGTVRVMFVDTINMDISDTLRCAEACFLCIQFMSMDSLFCPQLPVLKWGWGGVTCSREFPVFKGPKCVTYSLFSI